MVGCADTIVPSTSGAKIRATIMVRGAGGLLPDRRGYVPLPAKAMKIIRTHSKVCVQPEYSKFPIQIKEITFEIIG